MLLALARGATRLSEVAAAAPGISDRMLALRLNELAARSWSSARSCPPPRFWCGYHLTTRGQELLAPCDRWSTTGCAGPWTTRRPPADPRRRGPLDSWQVRLLLDGYGLASRDRVRFVDRIIEFVVRAARAEAVENRVTARVGCHVITSSRTVVVREEGNTVGATSAVPRPAGRAGPASP